MNDSIAKTLRCAPSARIAEVRNGESVLRCPTTRRGPTSYAGTALRVVPPPAAGGGSVERRQRQRFGEVGAGEQAGVAGVAGPRAVPRAPHVVGPAGDPAAVEPGPQGRGHGRGQRPPGELVGPGPAQQHRPPGHRPGQQHRVEGRVVGGVVAVAAGVLDVLHHDGRRVEVERGGDRVPQRRGCPGCARRRGRRPSVHTASPALGAIEAWARNGREYDASTAPGPGPGAPSSSRTGDLLVGPGPQPGRQVVGVGQQVVLVPRRRPDGAARAPGRRRPRARRPRRGTSRRAPASPPAPFLRR